MMTRNAIFKAYKHKKVVAEYESGVKNAGLNDTADGEKLVTTKDLLEIIELMISQLPEKQKEAFRMSRYENKTYSEIAECLGISQKTVQYYISQTLAELRKLTEAMLIFTTFDNISF